MLLNLDDKDIQLIFAGLSELPFKHVNQLLLNIQNQIKEIKEKINE